MLHGGWVEQDVLSCGMEVFIEGSDLGQDGYENDRKWISNAPYREAYRLNYTFVNTYA
jgi:hypothetical protein